MQTYLNRSVIIIVPKKPFYDWINYLDPKDPIDDLEDYNSLLLPDDFDIDEAAEFIKENYSSIFESHLFGMWTEETDWPQKRTLKIFKEWFNWHFSAVIIDTVEDEPIEVF